MSSLPTAHRDRFVLAHLPPPDLRPEKTCTLFDCSQSEPLNAASYLLDREGAGTAAACLSEDSAWTAAELRANVGRIAAVLTEDFGLLPGNRVLLRASNAPILLATLLAVLKIGAIAVPTVPLLRRHELDSVLRAARPDLALCTDDALSPLADTLTAVDQPCRLCSFGAPDAELEVRLAGRTAEVPTTKTFAGDPALILFSSGTTGHAKATVHSHGDIRAIDRTFGAHIFRARPGDVVTGTPSLGFAYGIGGLFIFPLAAGAAVAFYDRARSETPAHAVHRLGATMLVTAPTAYRKMLAHSDLPPMPMLRRCFSAGEHLPPAVAEDWYRRTGVPIVNLLGSTEMLGPYVSAIEEEQRLGTIGRAVPGYELRLLDAEGGDAAPGEAGRLAVRGPTGCLYLDPAEQAAACTEGWTVTSDICRIDGDGYVRFEGRADDMVLSAGYTISTVEVESVLVAHEAVQECAVVGVDDDERGSRLVAAVIAVDDTRADGVLGQALIDYVRATLAPYKAPRQVRFLSALPKTASGKVRRAELKRVLSVDKEVE